MEKGPFPAYATNYKTACLVVTFANSVCLSVCLSACLSACLPAYQSTHSPTHPSTHPSILPSIHLILKLSKEIVFHISAETKFSWSTSIKFVSNFFQGWSQKPIASVQKNLPDSMVPGILLNTLEFQKMLQGRV